MKLEKRRAYTQSDIEQIKALRLGGKTEREIASIMGRTYNSIHCRIKQMRRDGTLSPVRDITPLSPGDIEELAAAYHIAVYEVEAIISHVGKPIKHNVAKIKQALDQWVRQDGLCAYYGVPISFSASIKSPTRVYLMSGVAGEVMWVSAMAKKMRGALSHEIFLQSLSVIYLNTIAQTE